MTVRQIKDYAPSEILNEIRRLNEMVATVYEKAVPTGVVVKDGIMEFTYNKTVTALVDSINQHRSLLLKLYQEA